MCGRYTLVASTEHIMGRFGLQSAEAAIAPRYNIAPTQPAAVVLNTAPQTLSIAQWGVVPPWPSQRGTVTRLINARVETLAQKFRRLLNQRCLVLADGFYEWRRLPNGGKQPMRITLASGELFAMAGLWDIHRLPDGRTIRTFTVITTAPNPLVASIHARMPAILPKESEIDWLSRDQFDLSALHTPFPADSMIAYPVSPRVNDPKYDDPQLIQPLR
jgi:putative SOS response-associated peptidase YedK